MSVFVVILYFFLKQYNTLALNICFPLNTQRQKDHDEMLVFGMTDQELQLCDVWENKNVFDNSWESIRQLLTWLLSMTMIR